MTALPLSDGTAGVPRESYRAMVEQAPDAMIYSDCDGNIRLWNPAAAALFGYPQAEALDRSLDLIIPERFRAAHWNGFRKALAAGHTRYAGKVLTTRAVHKDGRRLYVAMSFGLISEEQGVVTGVLAIVRDVTEAYLANMSAKAPADTSANASKPPVTPPPPAPASAPDSISPKSHKRTAG